MTSSGQVIGLVHQTHTGIVDQGPLLPKYPIVAPSPVTDADERDESYSWEREDSQPLSEAAAPAVDHSSPEAMPAVRTCH